MSTKLFMVNKNKGNYTGSSGVVPLLFLYLSIILHSSNINIGSLKLNTFLFILFLSLSLLIIVFKKLFIGTVDVPKRLILLAVLLCYSIVTSAWSIEPSETFRSALYMILPSIAIYYCSYEITKNVGFEKAVKLFLYTFLVLFIILSIEDILSVEGRLKGTFSNSNQLGMTLSIIWIPFLIIQIFNKSFLKYLLLNIVVVLLIVLTFSRNALLMLFVGITVTLLTLLRKSNFSTLVKVLLVLLYTLSIFIVQQIIVSTRGYELGSRFDLYEIGKGLINFTGHGYGTSGILLLQNGLPWFNSWHNAYLGLLIEGGILWLIIGLMILFMPIVDSMKCRSSSKTYITTITVAVVLSFAVSQLFEFQLLRNTPLYYCFIAFCASVKAYLYNAKYNK